METCFSLFALWQNSVLTELTERNFFHQNILQHAAVAKKNVFFTQPVSNKEVIFETAPVQTQSALFLRRVT